LQAQSNILSVGVVAFYPDDSFYSTIKNFRDNGFSITVYNNGLTQQQSVDLHELALPGSGIKILGYGTNDGLGKSIRELTQNSITEQYEYLLMLDQDTLINDYFFSSISNLDLHSLFSNKYTTLQIISELDTRYKDCVSSEEIVLNINSGSIFNLKLCDEIHFHDNHLFVEGVDYDFCLRSREAGYKVGIIHGVKGLDHFSNQDGYAVKIFNKPFNVRVYPRGRILDFYRSHTKLLFQSLKFADFKATIIFVKLMTTFAIANILSMLIKSIEKKK